MIDYLSKFKLDGKIAGVCGGLGLLGKEVTIALAQAGAKVLILDTDKEQSKSFIKKCRKNNLDVEFLKFDITDLSTCDDKLNIIYNEYGPINIWVNSAYPRTKDWGNKLEDITIESWQKNVDIQMNSYCLITRSIAELMKKNEIKGSIINFGSIYGVVGVDFEVYSGTEMTCPAAYSAIKGGIINFSRYVASYYGKYGIRINCLCPGGIFDNQNKTFVSNYEKRTPLRRMGKPEEIAAATLFLASDAASYITGTTFMVDGGWTSI